MHAPPSGAPFRKRTFSLPLYARSLAALMTASPMLVRALNRPRISPALREQIMLAVTSVNDCRYCNWGHTALALRNGVDLAALRQTLDSGSLSADRTPEEVAILYAQHVASEQGDADPGAERALAAAWTPDEQAEIKAYITAITFGNLVGNSADAWLARLRRVPVEGGRRASGRGGDRGPGRLPSAPVSVGVEPHAGIRGDQLAMSSSWQSLHDSPRRGTPHGL